MAEVTRVSASPAQPPGSVKPAGRPGVPGPLERSGPPGPIERVMSTVIRKLSWSKLSDPRIAVTVSGIGLLLGMLVGAMAQNDETLPLRLPLSHLLPSLHGSVLPPIILYTGDVLARLAPAAMHAAHSHSSHPAP